MTKRIIPIILLLMSMILSLGAADLTGRNSFQPNENVVINFANMEAQNHDWVGIYPQNSNNDWANVVAWRWTGDTTNGNLDFGILPLGAYEARAFYNNSFHTETTKAFRVANVMIQALVNTNKPIYMVKEQIHVNFSHMQARNDDWIGIYPEDANNDFNNVVAWQWTGDTANGDLNFGALPAGSYEVRAFYNNSFHTESTAKFKVEEPGVQAAVNTNKAIYMVKDQIHVNFSNMRAKHDDWIGIYPEDANNEFLNVVAWKWTGDTANGDLNFGSLPVGSYEVRAFYNNSFHTEATAKFKVEEAGDQATLNTNKAIYMVKEQIHVNFSNMRAKNDDWIGIYPENTNNDWENVVAWKWTGDTTNGDLNFGSLPAGSYEVRAFYNNSFHTEATAKFKVEQAGAQAAVNTNKALYAIEEEIHVNFSNMQAKNDDWIGIYPENANNDFNNVVAWTWTGDTANGDINFGNLAPRSYEVRAFYNNSFHTEASVKFRVSERILN